jgi:hypothetical protein
MFLLNVGDIREHPFNILIFLFFIERHIVSQTLLTIKVVLDIGLPSSPTPKSSKAHSQI